MPQIRNYDPPTYLLTRVKSGDASASKNNPNQYNSNRGGSKNTTGKEVREHECKIPRDKNLNIMMITILLKWKLRIV